MKIRLAILLSLLGLGLSAQNVNVTFQVDMSLVQTSFTTVNIAGSFQDWTPAEGGLTDMGAGIWQRSYSIPENSTIQFKFTTENDWFGVEQVPADCGIDDGFGGLNRTLVVETTDINFGPVCFSSCESCTPLEFVPVTFRVDMSNETVGGTGVHVTGDFQGWDPASSELLPVGMGVYEGTFPVIANTTIYYKFINGNDWPGEEAVPADCGTNNNVGGYDRFLEVENSPITTDEVCFAGCFACGETVPVLVTFQVDMSNEIIDPLGVYMTGSFNEFDPSDVQMSPSLDGIYEATLVLNPGQTISYKFLNGPSFDAPEDVPMECGVEDGFGGYNRSFTPSEMPETVDLVCFGACSPCPSAESYLLTLRVDMGDEMVSSEGVYVAGSFNDFDPSANQMMEISLGLFELSIEVAAESTTIYKFLNGPSFEFEETVPSDCGQPDGFGAYNRAVFMSQDTELDPVCFSSCSLCATGINDILLEDFELFPNPVKDSFMLRGLDGNKNVLIYDLNGRLVGNFPGMAPGSQVDISSLQIGMYILQIEGYTPKKLILE